MLWFSKTLFTLAFFYKSLHVVPFLLVVTQIKTQIKNNTRKKPACSNLPRNSC